PATCAGAVTVRLSPIPTAEYQAADFDSERLVSLLDGTPLLAGNLLRVPLYGRQGPLYRVQGTTPDGPVVVTPRTWIKLLPTAEPDPRLTGVMWEDVGGLDRAVERVRKVVELPLRHPDLFAR